MAKSLSLHAHNMTSPMIALDINAVYTVELVVERIEAVEIPWSGQSSPGLVDDLKPGRSLTSHPDVRVEREGEGGKQIVSAN